MGVERSTAVVIGRFPLGESDRVVTFFTRHFGKVRGVAKSARRMKSRFGSALELFTLGELIFFDTGKSDLVRVDHFDTVRPFERIREDLDRLGQAAWMAECVGRLTAERDPNAALYGLLVRALGSVERGVAPAQVAVAFGVRCVDVLGHRLRIDGCVGCGRAARAAALDLEGGGMLCARCAEVIPGAMPVAAATLAALARLRHASWDEAMERRPGQGEAALREILDAQIASLIGYPTRTSRFLREVSR